MAHRKKTKAQWPAWLETIRRVVSPAAARAAEALGWFGRTYLAVLLVPAEGIPAAVSAGTWTFALGMLAACSVLETVLFWAAVAAMDSSATARLLTAVNAAYSFLALMGFLVALSGSLWAGCRIFARQKPTLLGATNCVAVALVPFSALTAGAGAVLYLFRALAVLMGVYAALVAAGYLAEAMRTQSDFSPAQSLYVIPLMIVAAMFFSGVGLLILRGLLPAGV